MSARMLLACRAAWRRSGVGGSVSCERGSGGRACRRRDCSGLARHRAARAVGGGNGVLGRRDRIRGCRPERSGCRRSARAGEAAISRQRPSAIASDGFWRRSDAPRIRDTPLTTSPAANPAAFDVHPHRRNGIEATATRQRRCGFGSRCDRHGAMSPQALDIADHGTDRCKPSHANVDEATRRIPTVA